MAGIPGKSGGKRMGAGRKAKPPPPVVPVFGAEEVVAHLDAGMHSMLRMLQEVALGLRDAAPIQVRAAIAAVQYTHTKRHDGGKKEEQEGLAKKAASKFKAGAAPLKLVGRKG